MPSLKSNGKGEEDKIASGLAALHHEDPTFLHHGGFRIAPDRSSPRRANCTSKSSPTACAAVTTCTSNCSEPRVRYRETIKAKGDSKYRHKKQTGGAGQFAEVWMRIEPKPRDTGVEFTQSLVGQNVDRVFVPSVEKGVMQGLRGRHPGRLPRGGRED